MQTIALSRAAVRDLDRRAIEEHGIPSFTLMENAGREAAREVLALRRAAGPVVVLCGPGNNGGDGLVVARTLLHRDVPVEVAFVGAREQLAAGSADVQLNLALWRDVGGEVAVCTTAEEVAERARSWSEASVLVDALFGTGLSRPLASPWTDAVRAVEAAGVPVLSIDLPSGLDADTGEVLGAAVRADVTVTFLAPKLGFQLREGPRLAGRVLVAEIGVPKRYLEEAASSG